MSRTSANGATRGTRAASLSISPAANARRNSPSVAPPNKAAEKEAVWLQRAPDLQEGAGQIVDRVQRENAHDQIEASLRERQCLFIRGEGNMLRPLERGRCGRNIRQMAPASEARASRTQVERAAETASARRTGAPPCSRQPDEQEIVAAPRARAAAPHGIGSAVEHNRDGHRSRSLQSLEASVVLELAHDRNAGTEKRGEHRALRVAQVWPARARHRVSAACSRCRTPSRKRTISVHRAGHSDLLSRAIRVCAVCGFPVRLRLRAPRRSVRLCLPAAARLRQGALRRHALRSASRDPILALKRADRLDLVPAFARWLATRRPWSLLGRSRSHRPGAAASLAPLAAPLQSVRLFWRGRWAGLRASLSTASLLRRSRATPSQGDMPSASARRRNVQGAFRVDRRAASVAERQNSFA